MGNANWTGCDCNNFFHFPTAFLSTLTVYKNGFFLLSTK
ncbi:hypothetical protein CUZ89_0998 [Enterococcus xinjiangensis]|nr:hypothetical protein [Enterococcus lactis]